MLRYLTAGESHGQSLTSILEGMPAGLRINKTAINRELARRQSGYGRGKRMQIEHDTVQITSGLRRGLTLGSPITMTIKNKDWQNWKNESPITNPRPGHADLAGMLKYNQLDIRNILERSSARETAARVAVGAVAKNLLSKFGIEVTSCVCEIGGVDENKELMREKIDHAQKNGDSLGGIFEVTVKNVPVGLGSHVHWDRKLDGRLARCLMSIQGIKGVEIGLGFAVSKSPGSKVHDEITYDCNFERKTNNAGGIEGGISNGEDIVIRGAMKPIPTLKKALNSIDIITKKPVKAKVERSDVCAVYAASVVGEAVVAFEIANAMCEKFGGDSIKEMKRNYNSYMRAMRKI
ncbi:chorismate synthase [bacterium]|nr:chorismate synthase [bacterium]